MVAIKARGWSALDDLSVNIKIVASVVTAVALAIVVGVLGLTPLAESSQSAQLISTSNVASITAVGDLRTAFFETIQADTTGAVRAIGEVSQVITRINDFQTTIALARMSAALSTLVGGFRY